MAICPRLSGKRHFVGQARAYCHLQDSRRSPLGLLAHDPAVLTRGDFCPMTNISEILQAQPHSHPFSPWIGLNAVYWPCAKTD